MFSCGHVFQLEHVSLSTILITAADALAILRTDRDTY